MRCLALRDNLPADLRFTLSLLQSKIGCNYQSQQPEVSSMEIDGDHEKNELLHLLLSTGSKVIKLGRRHLTLKASTRGCALLHRYLRVFVPR